MSGQTGSDTNGRSQAEPGLTGTEASHSDQHLRGARNFNRFNCDGRENKFTALAIK